MSLDVYLTGATTTSPCMCPKCYKEHMAEHTEEFYSANITHNFGKMADEAGIYEHLWQPEEIGISKASQLIEPLRIGLALLKSDPDRFSKFDASNGWGLYIHFVPFVEKYLKACKEYPDADVRVSLGRTESGYRRQL